MGTSIQYRSGGGHARRRLLWVAGFIVVGLATLLMNAWSTQSGTAVTPVGYLNFAECERALANRGRPPEHWKSVVLVTFDGISDTRMQQAMEAGDAPQLAAIVHNGGSFVPLVNPFTTDTGCGNATILTGCPPLMHHVRTNLDYDPIPSGLTIYERLKKSKDMLVTYHIPEGSPSSTDDLYADPGRPYCHAFAAITYCVEDARDMDDSSGRAATLIEKLKATRWFGWVHFREAEGRGMIFGENSPEFLVGIQKCDRALNRLVDALWRSGQLDTTGIYVVADHGMDPGKKSHFHAGRVFLASNDDVPAPEGATLMSVCPLILNRMGIDPGRMADMSLCR